MKPRVRAQGIAALLLGSVIVAGLARGWWDDLDSLPGWIRLIAVICLIPPWTFAFAAFLRLAGLAPIPHLIRPAVGCVATGSLLIVVVSAALSGPGFPFVFIQTLAASGAVIGAAALLECRMRLALATAAFPIVIAIWSLGSGAAAASGANLIADGRDYCVAGHGGPPVRSWAELRGVALYTDRAGYKSTSRWYFHAVLLVDDADGGASFNWSPRRLRWERLEYPERLIEPVRGSCEPSPAFLRQLHIF